jgi:hypothetical protein
MAVAYRRIPRWPAYYRVGDDGSLWSARRGGRWRRLKTPPANGHPRAVLTSQDGKTHYLSLAVLICRAFHGPRPIGCEVLHYPDPDPANCRAENLWWAPVGTSKLGLDPLPGRHPDQRGERNPCRRLNTELVVRARAEYAAGRRTADLATELGVSGTTILLAVSGKTWGHVPGAVTRPPQPTRGADVNTSRLFDWQVLEIRRKATEGRSQRSLAREYGVSQTAIRLIILRKNWAHLPDE